jgi:hypothetical protein
MEIFHIGLTKGLWSFTMDIDDGRKRNGPGMA